MTPNRRKTAMKAEGTKRTTFLTRAVSIQPDQSDVSAVSTSKYQTATPSLFQKWKSFKRERDNRDDVSSSNDNNIQLDDIILLDSFEENSEHNEELIITVCRENIYRDLIDFMKNQNGSVQLLYDIENYKITEQNIEDALKKATKFETNVAFLWSLFLKRKELNKYFLLSGVDFQFYEPRQFFGPLNMSSFTGCLESTQFLVNNGADVNRCLNTFTPLHCAAFGNSTNVAKLLLRSGAKITSAGQTETVLHSAVRAKSLDCIQLFIDEEADINEFNSSGINALHLAADLGNHDCLQLLLESGKADVDIRTTNHKYTALHFAAEGGFENCVKLLLEHNADPNLTNDRRQTALHLAAKSCLECVQILVEVGKCDPNAQDVDNRTPLHVAVCKSESEFSYEITEVLISWRSEVNKKDKYGYTPLHIAALNELSECVETLIAHGADVCAKTKGGTTALGIISRKTPAALGVLENKLDESITIHDPDVTYKEISLKFNFRYFLQSCEKGEMNFLQTVVDEGQKEILQHPLCEAFLYLKWEKIRKYYMARLLFCFVYTLLLSVYVLMALAYQCYNDSKPDVVSRLLVVGDPDLCQDKSYIGDFLRRHPYVLEVEWFILVVFTIIEILRKFYGLYGYVSYKKYFTQVSNIVEIFVIVSVFLISFAYTGRTYTWQNHVGAFSVLFGWANLMVMIGHLPVFGSYVTMYTRVQKEFTKLFLAYICLLIGFSICFCVIFPRSPQFTNPFVGFIKILVMMTGELDFNDLLANIQGENIEAGFLLQLSAHVTFVLFLLFITVILMNLLVGIAVHDIQGLQKTAGLSKLVDQTNLISHIESALFTGGLPKYLLKMLTWTALVSPSAYRVVITVKPLNSRECRLPKEVMRSALELAKHRRCPLGTQHRGKTSTRRKSMVRKAWSSRTSDSELFQCIKRLTEEVERLKNVIQNNKIDFS